MQLIGKILNRIYGIILELSSKQRKVTYLRKKRILIGQDCEIRTLSYELRMLGHSPI